MVRRILTHLSPGTDDVPSRVSWSNGVGNVAVYGNAEAAKGSRAHGDGEIPIVYCAENVQIGVSHLWPFLP